MFALLPLGRVGSGTRRSSSLLAVRVSGGCSLTERSTCDGSRARAPPRSEPVSPASVKWGERTACTARGGHDAGSRRVTGRSAPDAGKHSESRAGHGAEGAAQPLGLQAAASRGPKTPARQLKMLLATEKIRDPDSAKTRHSLRA